MINKITINSQKLFLYNSQELNKSSPSEYSWVLMLYIYLKIDDWWVYPTIINLFKIILLDRLSSLMPLGGRLRDTALLSTFCLFGKQK